jgi:hypothetical protein
MPPSDANAAMSPTLHALEIALSYTRAAVLAAHPDLRESGPHGRRLMKLDAAGWMADEILTHLAELSGAIARYSVEVERQRIRAMVVGLPRPREWAA